MVDISAKDVAELRKKTGAGMMDCKAALVETAGDPEKAVEVLRVKGVAKALSKSGRETKEGLVLAIVSEGVKTGAMVEVNCETDFVARTDDFKNFVGELADVVLTGKSGTIEDESGDELYGANLESDPSKTVEDHIKEVVSKLGENIRVAHYCRFEVVDGSGIVNSYIHMGGKAGVLIEAHTDDGEFQSTNEFVALTEEIAIHICALSPDFIEPVDVPEDVVDGEKQIFREQALAEGKPEQIVEKIIQGRLHKYYKDTCLMSQAFYRDESGKQTVRDFIKEAAGGRDVTITRFTRYQLGG